MKAMGLPFLSFLFHVLYSINCDGAFHFLMTILFVLHGEMGTMNEFFFLPLKAVTRTSWPKILNQFIRTAVIGLSNSANITNTVSLLTLPLTTENIPNGLPTILLSDRKNGKSQNNIPHQKSLNRGIQCLIISAQHIV